MSGISPSAAAEPRTPLPLPLGACVLLLLLLGVEQAAEAHALGATLASLLPAGLAGLNGALALGLYARRRWARPGAALWLVHSALLALLAGDAGAGPILVPALAAIYLLAPSTGRLFREGGVSTLDRRTLLAGGLVLLLGSLLGVLLEWGAPAWVTHLAAVAGGRSGWACSSWARGDDWCA